MLTGALLLIGIVIGAVVLAGAFIYVRQDRLLFYPVRNDPQLRAHWRWKRIEITAGDHVLEGWWADGADPNSSLTILYFGGNAEDVLVTARHAGRLEAKRMLVVNYRGYGQTKGRPSQHALFEDALAIYDYALGPGGADPQDIVVMGRSLGSGVAAMLAARREPRAAILITPFDSISAVAAHHYPAFIVDRLLRHPFPSTEFATSAKAPALFLIAELDSVIPPSHASTLAAAWRGEKHVHVLDGVGHNDIEAHAAYYPFINDFLRSLSKAAVRSATTNQVHTTSR
jgi:pimeloyl-ACP methyl ester carboxylesterase